MFGRRKKQDESEPERFFPEVHGDSKSADVSDVDSASQEHDIIESDAGPYDFEDLDDDFAEPNDQRLDLGSVILPIVAGGQLQVEMGADGSPQAVHLMTEHGRITVAAYAAPKSPGQWREVIGDLATSLRNENGTVTIENGPWGRELVASTEGADLRFIGVDGYRWMVRVVAAGTAGSTAEGSPLTTTARAVLRETVVRRGTDPHPVRTPLPVTLPQAMAEQLAAAHQQQLAAQEAAAEAAAAQAAAPVAPQAAPQAPKPPRRGAEGSAMQQLGR